MGGYGGEGGTDTPQQTGGAAILDQRSVRPGARSDQVINIKQRVGTSDITLFTADEDKGGAKLPSAKSLQFRNEGNSALGVQMKLNHWTNATTENTDSASVYLQFLVRKGEIINFPMSRIISSVADGVLSGTSVTNTAPDSNMYTDSTADVDHATASTIGSDATHTTLNLEDGHSKFFRVGDLIRLEDEICEVTAVGTGADLANSTCTIIRGLHGSQAATHADDVAVRFPFFNAYHPFTAATGGYDKVQTDNDGKFKATNFFGYGRGVDLPTAGLLPGSIAIKCYNPGYQELGLSGITPGTPSGLTAGGSYWLKLSIDGSTAESINFTVDASNTNMGGRNGILSKVQEVINEKYYNTAANIFEQKATVGIVNGDIRFTSGSYLSTSAIALTAGVDGASASYNIFAQQNGRFPILAKIEDAIAARLPDDTIPDPTTGNAISNTSAFMYDNGHGRLVGNGSGTIDYDTGVIDFTSKPNAEFVVSAIHTGALAGNVTETTSNTIMEIKARSLNPKVEGKINVVIGG